MRGRARFAAGTALSLAVATLALAPARPAAAQQSSPGSTEPTPIRSTLPERPAEYEVGPNRALRIADGAPDVATERDRRGPLSATVTAEAPRRWEVGYFDPADRKVVLVVIDGVSGAVLESWTGEQVLWPMARGREGQFGHVLNAPYVWIPMAAVFFLALFDRRRPWRLAHLDLLALLSFGVSHAFFNAAEIGVSVPLYYPPLLYLLARMLWVGFRRRSDRHARLRPSTSVRVMVVLCVLLAAFRITINIVDSGVIDVGYAGVIGADRIADGEPIYGEGAFPSDNPTGDTYGPANYFAYVPFEQALPWSGGWDELPAAHAAAIFFDLLCVAGLVVLGRRLSGSRLAATLTLAWLAYPYTAFVLQSNANDALLAALLIWSLALFSRPVARGVLLGLAAATKFAPLALAPLYFAGRRGLLAMRRDRSLLRPAALYAVAFAAAVALLVAHPALDPGLATFWERTVGSQAGRDSPFSLWGQADLELLHTVAKIAAAALAVLVAFIPARRDMRRIAALGAAALIAVQLTAEHWFYLYIVWFLPFVLLAIAPSNTPEGTEVREA